jgi:hypothetical protein
MTGRIEGAMAVLGLTGQNAKMAAADLEEVTNAAGAMDEAFQEVERVTPLAKLRQALDNMVLTAGDAALKALGPLLTRAADGAAKFAEQIAQWADTGVLAAAWEHFFETLRHGFAMVSGHVHLAFAAVVDGVERQLPKLKALVLTAFAAAVPTLSNIKAAAEAAKDVVTKTAEITSDRAVAAMAVIEAERKQHADRMTAIVEKQTATQVKLQEEAAKEVVAVQKEAANKVDDIRNNSTLKLKQALEKEQKLIDKLSKAKDDIQRKALRKEIAQLEEAQAKRKEIADNNVAGILEEARQRKEQAKQEERDRKKAERLRKKRDRPGVHLGREQREFLEAFEQIEAAKAGVKGGAQMIRGAKKRLELLDKQEKTLGEIKGELEKTRKKLEELLVRD